MFSFPCRVCKKTSCNAKGNQADGCPVFYGAELDDPFCPDCLPSEFRNDSEEDGSDGDDGDEIRDGSDGDSANHGGSDSDNDDEN